ncbi:hypothetical protein GLAREA_12977 [Glarea lozoyensis ATCC 20868]|uniref:Uncharacterized protein n=1 Tax=Glarea lozoyensis (strain ATCC 20868 / MF5171) TaxID=1116229 RepID=S3CZB5_GLAL2|nr:uncharacterized protein GLAREA_12977 [Glarea lozoyensis ATCC 20868]EPE30254.1 hypothetical protein GLAREA_12977 [Glarea lozoyensis ATCC 20868]
MASSKDTNGVNGEGGQMGEEDLAKVWKDLMKGEKTANILESNLTSLEKKIDDLLASFEEQEKNLVTESTGTDGSEMREGKGKVGDEGGLDGTEKEGEVGGENDGKEK